MRRGLGISWAVVIALAAPLSAGAPSEAEAQAHAPCAAEDGGPRRWVVADPAGVELRAAASEDAGAVARAPGGAILSNLGCATIDGRVWRAVRPFRGGARGHTASEALRPAQGPDGTTPMGLDDSARRARRGDFDAEGEIACAQNPGQAMGRCSVAIARGGGGDATVIATFANRFARRLSFANGAFIGADATMSGVGRDIAWRLEDGVHIIRVDDQRYALPNALVFGD